MSKTINLLPDPVIETQKEVSTVFQGTLVSIIGLVIFILFNLILILLLTNATNQYDAVQQQISDVEAEIRSYSDVNRDLRSIRSRLQRYVRLDLENVDTGMVYGGVVNGVNESVSIFRFQLQDEALNIRASANSLEGAVDFLREVRRNEELADIQVIDIGYSTVEDDTVSFETVIELKKEPDA